MNCFIQKKTNIIMLVNLLSSYIDIGITVFYITCISIMYYPPAVPINDKIIIIGLFCGILWPIVTITLFVIVSSISFLFLLEHSVKYLYNLKN